MREFRRKASSFAVLVHDPDGQAPVLLVFAVRLAKTKKFMPSGLILAATVVVLAVLNISFH